MKKNYFTLKKGIAALGLVTLGGMSLQAQIITQTFTYTGATQTFVVPSCVSTISVDIRGAQGGTSYPYSSYIMQGGNGGQVIGTMTVAAGQTLNINVGGAGSNGASATIVQGGFNGGGNGGAYVGIGNWSGGAGGGASDIRVNGVVLADRVIVAGGGGGGGSNNSTSGYDRGGMGGGLTGEGGYENNILLNGGAPGGGGSSTTGGSAGFFSGFCTGSAGSLGSGGAAGTCGNSGGGGGGGYYGGGGGVWGGGGGGSSYTDPSITGVVHTAGFQTGNGLVVLSYQTNGAGVIASASSNSICSGATPTLNASNVISYTWSPGGSNATSMTVSPTSTSSYTLEGTNSIGCTSSAIITITVDPALPVLTVVNTSSSSGGICPNTTVALTASGASGYTWTGGSSTVTNGAVFSLTAAAEYTVTGINACGTSTAVTSVSVHPFPSVTPVASTSSLCSGNSVTLTGVGDATLYAWSGGAGGITDGVGFSPILTATYTVIGTSALSCTASATIPVTVVTTPSLAPTAQPQLICIGNSSTLTATGAASYTWTDGSTTANTSTFLTTPTGTGITTYTVMRANSTCTTSQQISVITNSLPTLFAIVAPTLVCALNPATLAVGGGQTYTWTSPGNPPSVPSFSFTGPSPVVYPPVPTTYTVAASDGTCINTTTVGLAVDPNPTITTMPTAPMVCSGESVGITANGGINYTWTATSGTFYTQSITDMPTISAAYNVQGDNSFGCITSANQVIVVNANPTVTAVANKTLVCSAGPTTLTAGGANTYVWDNSAMTNTTIVNPVNSTSGLVTYSVTGTYTSTGCHTTKTVQVAVFVPTLTVSGNTNTCSGGQINLTASGGTGNSYSWLVPGNPPYGFPTINTTVSAASVFTVTAMTTSLTVSCPGTKTVEIGIYYNPTITATPERTAICTKELVVLTATGGVTYLWSNNAGGETITVNPASTTNYTVTGTDANGCTSTGTVQVKVLGCAGIGEAGLVNTGLSIYPNPNNGEFYIQANTNLNLTLVNELGQTVRSIALLGSNNYKVSVGELAKGIYFITGQKDGLQINQKIVVVK